MVRIYCTRPVGPPIPTEDFVFDTTPSPVPDTPFPFLSLLPELRRKVYLFLLRSTVPLYPTVKTNPILDLKRLKPYPQPSIDTSILRVSKQVHDEASAVLYGSNRIVLQFPPNWMIEYNNSRSDLPTSQRHHPYHVRRTCFVPPPHYLRSVCDLVVEVFLMRAPHRGHIDKPAAPATKVRRQLAELSEGLGGGHTLNSCEVRFGPMAVRDVPNESPAKFDKGLRHFDESAPGEEGVNCFCRAEPPYSAVRYMPTTSQVDPYLRRVCSASAVVDQQVLEPLTELRGIGYVEITGRMTDEWSEYLKSCMTAKPGTQIGVFDHPIPVQWPEPLAGKKRKRTGKSRS